MKSYEKYLPANETPPVERISIRIMGGKQTWDAQIKKLRQTGGELEFVFNTMRGKEAVVRLSDLDELLDICGTNSVEYFEFDATTKPVTHTLYRRSSKDIEKAYYIKGVSTFGDLMSNRTFPENAGIRMAIPKEGQPKLFAA